MLQMEIAMWAPKNRRKWDEKGAKMFVDSIKEHGPFPVSIGNPQYKSGLQQIWWDVSGNRSFALWYDHEGFTEPMRLFKEYESMIDIMNFELVNLMELGEFIENDGQDYWKYTGYTRPDPLPRIQMEIATWAPENRKEVLKRRAAYFKEHGPFSVIMGDPPYNKPGIQQLWWDITCNRSFCLLYDIPGFDNNKGILNEYKPGLHRLNFVLINVMETAEFLEYMVDEF